MIKSGKPGDKNMLANNNQEIVIFIGSPGSGKSTIWSTYFSDYVRVNNDTLKTPANCLKLTYESLKEGKSVCIDNTNPSKQRREDFINLAKE